MLDLLKESLATSKSSKNGSHQKKQYFSSTLLRKTIKAKKGLSRRIL